MKSLIMVALILTLLIFLRPRIGCLNYNPMWLSMRAPIPRLIQPRLSRAWPIKSIILRWAIWQNPAKYRVVFSSMCQPTMFLMAMQQNPTQRTTKRILKRFMEHQSWQAKSPFSAQVAALLLSELLGYLANTGKTFLRPCYVWVRSGRV